VILDEGSDYLFRQGRQRDLADFQPIPEMRCGTDILPDSTTRMAALTKASSENIQTAPKNVGAKPCNDARVSEDSI
jgi:hypothetical protein